MAATRREISADARARWEEMRATAAARQRELIGDCPSDDPLDRLAWKAGTMPELHFPFDNELREMIEAARDARMTWREIAVALGEGEEQATVNSVKSKQQWRNRVYDEETTDD